MREQHLSDEAIAAFADDVLVRHARERARKHISGCAECAYAVAVQREAVWALRSAPSPALPAGLLERLRDVAANTPIENVPISVDDDGTPMFPTFGAAAFVPPAPPPAAASKSRLRRGRPLAMTAASFTALGFLAVTTVSADSAAPEEPAQPNSVVVYPVSAFTPSGASYLPAAARVAGAVTPLHS